MSESKGARREELRAARRALEALPPGEINELAGRPLLLYEIRKYPRSKEGAKAARSDLPFLFKAFETGQVGHCDCCLFYSLVGCWCGGECEGYQCGQVGLHLPQAPPPRGQVTSLVDAPRAATIHEYLDWTVTAEEASTDEELVRPCFQLLGRFAHRCRPARLLRHEHTRRWCAGLWRLSGHCAVAALQAGVAATGGV